MNPRVSMVIPAYNEAERITKTLTSVVDFFDRRGEPYEVLVVSDGSNDNTSEIVTVFAKEHPAVKLLSYPENRGKGYAVRLGATSSKGELVIYNDADGSSPIEEMPRLEEAIRDGADVAIGSRAMHSAQTFVKTVWYRKVIGRIFNGIVNCLLLPGVADTQCGFKMFTRRAADYVFSRQTAERFSFDVELLFLARRGGFRIAEVPINWTNVPGSKVNLVSDSFAMFLDLLRFRIRALFGGYSGEASSAS